MTTLRLACVIDDAAALPAEAVRHALALIRDETPFSITAFIEYKSAPARGAAAYRLVHAIDRALFARPRAGGVEPSFDIPVQTPQAFLSASGEVDVVIDFTEGGAPDALADAASHGLWRLSSWEPFAGFHDVLSAPVAEIVLSRRARVDAHTNCIARGAYNIKISAARTGAYIREKSALLLLRELKRLAADGAPRDLGTLDASPPRSPTVMETAAYSAGFVKALLDRGAEKLQERARLRPGMFFLKYGDGAPLDFDPASGREIAAPGNAYWADPFLFEENGRAYIFFEDYRYDTGRGHIGVGAIDEKGFAYIGPALETPYHLSYPFMFRQDGEIYMMPETNETRRLEIWRCVSFPDQWELCETALEGQSPADSVILERDGAWWLFTNLARGAYGDHNSELFVFRADGPLLQKLEPHPLNPVVIDARTARGGGRVFAHDGKLFRLSQDNSHGTYGYGLNVMEITRLDACGYDERLVRKITPDFESGLIGCHHGDFLGGAFVIDARRRRGGRPKRAT